MASVPPTENRNLLVGAPVELSKIFFFLFPLNRVGGVVVIVLASSEVDRGFEPRSGQT